MGGHSGMAMGGLKFADIRAPFDKQDGGDAEQMALMITYFAKTDN